MEFITKSAGETKKLGEKMAVNIGNKDQNTAHKDKAVVLALSGNLGSGKTTFVQGLAKGLGIEQRIISPTYIIMRNYKVPQYKVQRTKYKGFYHIDLYRLEKNPPGGEASIEREITNLGLKEIWSDPKNIIAIEWAERAKGIIPQNATWIEFENVAKGKRKITRT